MHWYAFRRRVGRTRGRKPSPWSEPDGYRPANGSSCCEIAVLRIVRVQEANPTHKLSPNTATATAASHADSQRIICSTRSEQQ